MRNLTIFFFFFLISVSADAINWIGGNGLWKDGANWNTGTVPGPGDDVYIGSGNVEISDIAFAARVSVAPGAVLNITSAGELIVEYAGENIFLYIQGDLKIDGQVHLKSYGVNASVSYHVMIRPSGILDNNGYINIHGNETGTGINLSSGGQFINQGLVEIENVGIGLRLYDDFHNYGDLFLGELSLFGITCYDVIINEGSIQLEDIYLSGIGNHGAIENKGDISIDNTGTQGIRNEDGASFINHPNGNVYIQHADSYALYNFDNGNFHNQGDLSINHNHITASAINNAGAFTNYSTGEVNVNFTNKYGISNGGIYVNYGNTNTHTNTGKGGINNGGNFKNIGIHAHLWIDGGNERGLNNYGFFDNRSKLDIVNTSSIAIINNAVFRNRYGGDLYIQNNDKGIYNTSTFINKDAVLKISSDYSASYDISNSNTFENEDCAQLHTEGRIENHNGAIFTNDAWLTNTYKLDHAILGTFTNDGVIEDWWGKLDNTGIINYGAILRLLQGQLYVGQPYDDAIALGSLSNINIVGWWLDDEGSIPAGVYDPMDNSFTPSSDAEGYQQLYVEVEHDLGVLCKSQFLRVMLEKEISSFNASHPASVSTPTPESETFNLYPNPASEKCQLTGWSIMETTTSVELLNTQGQLVKTYLKEVSDSSVELDLSGLSPGVYYVQITGKERLLHKKLIIQ